LGLGNVRVFNIDVMELKDIQANIVTAMAVGSFRLLYCLTRHLHHSEVLLLSKKGNEFKDEIEELEQSLGINPDFVKIKPLAKIISSPSHLVSRETSYGNLVAVKLLGGRECTKIKL
jgi:16S rRNA G527 N7-methylase RsmG